MIFDSKSEDVRVVAPFLGGGFGGKIGWSNTALCVAAAKAVNRPVKLALSREGTFRMIGGRTISEQRVAVGSARRDGKLTALIHTGIDGDNIERTLRRAMHVSAAASLCVAESLGRAENRLPGYRREYMDARSGRIDRHVCSGIGDGRTRVRTADGPDRASAESMSRKKIRPRTLEFSSRNLTEAYRRGAEKFGWNARKREPRSSGTANGWIGQGVATAYYPYLRFPAKARVRMCADGSAIVQAPASEMGMGTATAQIQHAADRLGLPLDRVTFQYGDSGLPDTPMMAGGSNQTATTFAAVRAAVEQVAPRTAETGAQPFRFPAERCEI